MYEIFDMDLCFPMDPNYKCWLLPNYRGSKLARLEIFQGNGVLRQTTSQDEIFQEHRFLITKNIPHKTSLNL